MKKKKKQKKAAIKPETLSEPEQPAEEKAVNENTLCGHATQEEPWPGFWDERRAIERSRQRDTRPRYYYDPQDGFGGNRD